MLYRAKTALYSTTDPNGPDAARGVVTVKPPRWGYQLCGEGAVVSAEFVEKLALHRSAYFQPHDAEAAALAADERNKATYNGDYRPVISGPVMETSSPGRESAGREPAGREPRSHGASRASRQLTTDK